MSQFLRLLNEHDKAAALLEVSRNVRAGRSDVRNFRVRPEEFDSVPGKPFAYWVSEQLRQAFKDFPPFESNGRSAQHGGSTKDDFRFLRLCWEWKSDSDAWTMFAKGGSFSKYYSDIHLSVNWKDDARELEAALLKKYPYLGATANWVLHRECNYFQSGITWSRRTQGGLSLRALPKGCIFADKGPAAFVVDGDAGELLALLALTNSSAFHLLISLQMAFGSYEVGVIQRTPIPVCTIEQRNQLAELARRAWSLKRYLDSTIETSHAFLLPATLRSRLDGSISSASEDELAGIQAEIDAKCFALYGFTDADRTAAIGIETGNAGEDSANIDEVEDEGEGQTEAVDANDGLLSWTVGVSFGRFDWRLATGEREAPPEPEPFDPLPAKSAGMLPDDLAPFHANAGILVDDAGHPHDLTHLVEEVLTRVGAPVPDDVRRWLQKEFFPFHLQRYSKSRRKAPIYWPLSTASGDYTLWVYYPSLTSQTLYTAINDFLDGPSGKLKQVGADVTALRNKGSARTRDDEKQFEALQSLELELIELRDTLLKIAPTYKPNHDDGVQITAAPLWPLFRHKPWQKVLKETWAKLEKGEYDWSHLAMNYWPSRVRERCKTDKSLAIAHDLEHLYVEPEAAPKKPRGRKKRAEHE